MLATLCCGIFPILLPSFKKMTALRAIFCFKEKVYFSTFYFYHQRFSNSVSLILVGNLFPQISRYNLLEVWFCHLFWSLAVCIGHLNKLLLHVTPVHTAFWQPSTQRLWESVQQQEYSVKVCNSLAYFKAMRLTISFS